MLTNNQFPPPLASRSGRTAGEESLAAGGGGSGGGGSGGGSGGCSAGSLVFDTGVVLDGAQCRRSFGAWHGAIVDFTQSLHSMNVDLHAFACLAALTLITGNCTSSSSSSSSPTSSPTHLLVPSIGIFRIRSNDSGKNPAKNSSRKRISER